MTKQAKREPKQKKRRFSSYLPPEKRPCELCGVRPRVAGENHCELCSRGSWHTPKR